MMRILWTKEKISAALDELAKTYKELSKLEIIDLSRKGLCCHPDTIIKYYGSIRKELALHGIKYPKGKGAYTQSLKRDTIEAPKEQVEK